MKKMNKLLALVLAMVMVLGLAATAFAEGTTQTFTISAPAGSTHTYDIYQIFTGDLNEQVLSNVKWGQNGKNVTAGDAVAQEVLDALTAVNSKSNTEKLAVIQNYVDLTSEAFATLDTNNTSETVPAGYYLIKDRDKSVTGNDSYTLYIVKIVGNVTIEPKAEVPSFEKKLKDTNDTTGETSGWQDSADWDIGDKVPFQLKGTVASNYDYYKTYYFAFHDKEEAGLTFDSTSVKVFVDGNPITSGYEVLTNTEDKCTFEVIFKDLKKIDAVHAGSVITVEYVSELNSSANLGSQGNVNQAKLEFSNNPNEEQNGENKPETGETPWDYVIVFTYKTVVNKVTKNPAYGTVEDAPEFISLEGAGFTLYKKNTSNEYVAVGTEVKGDGMVQFTWTGLDDGDYKLVETTTPAGYNTIAPIEFTITADHKVVWNTEERTEILIDLDGGNKFTGEVTTGAVSGDVENNKGTTLPETGGIGTTIFYVLGGMLVVCAVVLMVSKKRMSAEG